MQKIILFFSLYLISNFSISSIIPDDYVFLVELKIPSEYKNVAPSDILFDNEKSQMAVSFGYNPSYVHVYETTEFKITQIFKIKGFTYFDSSYFGSSSNGNIYIDYGRYKAKYFECNLSTGETKKISCNKAPNGCGFDVSNMSYIEIHNGAMYVIKESYILEINENQFSIYLPKEELKEFE